MQPGLSESAKASISNALRDLNAGPKEWSGFEFLSWSAMRSVLEAKAIKAVAIWIILVPVILTLTSEFPDRYIAFPFGGEEGIPLVFEIPFNWFMLYFSAVCFALARLLYVAFCPEFIRKYGSSASASADGVTAEIVKDYASDYLGDRFSSSLNPLSPEGQRLNRFLNEITGENNLVGRQWESEGRLIWIQASVSQAHVREIPGTGTYSRSFRLAGNEEESEERLTSMLIWKFIDWLNYARGVARGFCSMLVVCGFILLSIPFVQGFLVVLEAFLAYASQS